MILTYLISMMLLCIGISYVCNKFPENEIAQNIMTVMSVIYSMPAQLAVMVIGIVYGLITEFIRAFKISYDKARRKEG